MGNEKSYSDRSKHVLAAAVTAVTAAGFVSAGFVSGAMAQEKVTIASWGGSYQDAQSKALFQPAQEASA